MTKLSYRKLLPEGKAAVVAHRTLRIGGKKVRVPILHFRTRSDFLKFQRNVSKVDVGLASLAAGAGGVTILTSYNQKLYGKPDKNIKLGLQKIKREIRQEKRAIHNLEKGLSASATRAVRPFKRVLLRNLKRF